MNQLVGVGGEIGHLLGSYAPRDLNPYHWVAVRLLVVDAVRSRGPVSEDDARRS